MVSVCIATYNGEKFIKKQLESILKQLQKDDEVIVSDDASTDGTLDVIRSLNDERIKIFPHKKEVPNPKNVYIRSFMLATANFEHAILQAKGDFIFLADQDDIWADTRVSSMLAALKENDFVMCNLSLVDDDDKVVLDRLYTKNPASSSFWTNLYRMPFRGCTMAFRASVLKGIVPFPPKCICHDNWIGLCLSYKKCKFHYLLEPLHLYRTHAENVSPVIGKSPNGFFFKIGYRLRFLYYIITRL
ncbi:MAG: glycosyltransferase [Paludibacteraceae bacterium]|nr:glycosyltransferase [Paludibacteraceae bacterium]